INYEERWPCKKNVNLKTYECPKERSNRIVKTISMPQLNEKQDDHNISQDDITIQRLLDDVRIQTGNKFVEKNKIAIDKNELLRNIEIANKKIHESDDLNSHLTYPCERPFLCHLCGKAFKNIGTLNQHEKTHVHTGVKLFICDKCGKRFYTNTKLKVHLHSHSDSMPFKCSICNKKFQDKLVTPKKNKKNKLSIKESKSIPCSSCDRQFSSKPSLYYHMKVNHGAKMYGKCNVCEKSFPSKQALENHERIHTNELPYKCNKIHTGEKPFMCPICNHSFTQKHVMQKHAIKLSREAVKEKPNNRMYYEDTDNIHQEEDDKYDCKICEEHFSLQEEFFNHLNQHGIEITEENKVCLTNEVLLNNTVKNGADDEFEDKIVEWECGTSNITKNVKPFQCKYCETFRSNEELTEHLDIHADDKSLLCHLCGKTFKNKNTLNHHTEIHESGPIRTCEKCGKAFKSISNFRDHLALHTGVKLFVCDKCGKSFYAHSNLKVHLHTHSEERPHKCNVCSQRFRWRKNLTVHERIHKKEKGLKLAFCDICEKSFPSKEALETHVRIHTNDRPYKCDKCNKTFRDCRTYRSHTKIHSDIKPHPCTYCGKKFRRKSQLDCHVRIHTGEKPFVCHICNHSFIQKWAMLKHVKHTSSLQVHLRIHTGERPFTCHVCGKQFRDSATREDHRRIHTGERPYICDSCGKTFKSKASLYIHSKIHTDSFPHECTYCEKRFRRRQELLAHVTTHTGEKPHACEICDKPYICTECGLSFRQKRYLKNHEKTRHHTIEPISLTLKRLRGFHEMHILQSKTIKNVINTELIFERGVLKVSYKSEQITAALIVADLSLFKDGELLKFTKEEQLADTQDLQGSAVITLQTLSCRCKQPLPTTFRSFQGISLQNDLCALKMEDETAGLTEDVHIKYGPNTKRRGRSRRSTQNNYEQLELEDIDSSRACGYQCNLCGKTLAVKENLKVHMRIHSGEKPFTCHICGKQFRWAAGLARHLKEVHAATRDGHRRIHTGERPYVCDACGKAFKTQATLYIHIKIHSDLFPFMCKHCGKKFRRHQDLVNHVTTHTGEKPHVCDVCGKGFGVKNDMRRHRRIHSDEKPYVCAICGLRFAQKRYLKNHDKNHHRRENHERGHQCTYVEKAYVEFFENANARPDTTRNPDVIRKFKQHPKSSAVETLMLTIAQVKGLQIEHDRCIMWSAEVARIGSCIPREEDLGVGKPPFLASKISEHPQLHHSTGGHALHRASLIPTVVLVPRKGSEDLKNNKCGYSCEVCRKIFKKKEVLRDHTRIHSGVRPYVCHVCGKQFRTRGLMKGHISRIHDRNKNFDCDICGRKFSEKGARDGHRRSHTGERPLMCDKCGKSFMTYTSLYVHKRSHTDYFPFSCSYCSKKFRTRATLSDHLVVHTGEKPHTCDICGKSFGMRRIMIEHRRIHSGEKPFVCESCGRGFKRREHLKAHGKTHRKDAEKLRSSTQERGIQILCVGVEKTRVNQERLDRKLKECKTQMRTPEGIVDFHQLKHAESKNNEHVYTCKEDERLAEDLISCYRSIVIFFSEFAKYIWQKLVIDILNCVLPSCLICDIARPDYQNQLQQIQVLSKKTEESFAFSQVPHLVRTRCQTSFTLSHQQERAGAVSNPAEKLSFLHNIDNKLEESYITLTTAEVSISTSHLEECISVHRNKTPPFFCGYCSKVFKRRDYLTEHIKICYENSYSTESRDDHRRSHTGERPLMCDKCGKAYPSHTALYIHKRTHSDYYPFTCSYCSKKFRTRATLNNHVVSHTGEKHYPCEICGKSFGPTSVICEQLLIEECAKCPFKCQTSFKVFHQRQRDATTNLFKKSSTENKQTNLDASETCKTEPSISKQIVTKNDDSKSNNQRKRDPFDNFFSSSDSDDDIGKGSNSSRKTASKSGMKQEIDSEDNNLSTSETEDEDYFLPVFQDMKDKLLVTRGEKKQAYTCEHCGKMYDRKDYYNDHLNIHLGLLPYVCQVCGKQFRTSRSVTVHIERVHEKKRDHACDICGMRYPLKSLRDDHRRKHTGERPMMCDVCGKRFRSYILLYDHKKSHKDVFPYSCTYCEKKFKKYGHLKEHIVSHTEEKPYPCEICGKGFGTKNRLRHHSHIHSNVKPHVCELCGRGFKRREHLKAHGRTHKSYPTI
ncbi:hypothetical protein L9F63_006631, partial [Diploptera punctata]